MIDINNLDEKDKNLLIHFFHKRKLFDAYIKKNDLELYTCPGCAYPTLSERGGYEICSVCNWEDDNQDDENADKICGGPNGKLSLTENRINIGRIIDEGNEPYASIDPLKSIQIINDFDRKLKEIQNRMTGNETLQNPIWDEWRKVEKDLQIALGKINS